MKSGICWILHCLQNREVDREEPGAEEDSCTRGGGSGH